jgi:hypothetical protein
MWCDKERKNLGTKEFRNEKMAEREMSPAKHTFCVTTSTNSTVESGQHIG